MTVPGKDTQNNGKKVAPKEPGNSLKHSSLDDSLSIILEIEKYRLGIKSSLDNAEKALQDSCQKYINLFDFCPIAYLVLDARTHIVEINNTGSALLGQERQLLSGRPFSDFVSPPELDRFHDFCRRTIKAGTRQLIELRMLRHDGSHFYAELVAIPESGASDSSLRISITDITRIKKAEEANRLVLESITDGFIAFDQSWRYVYVNETAAKLLHTRREDLLGRPGWEVFPEAGTSKFWHEFRRAMRENKTINFEEFYPEPLNVWYECYCYPTSAGLAVFFRDVTARKLTEVALQQSKSRFQSLSERLHLLLRLTGELVQETSTDKLISRVVRAACELTQAASGTASYDFSNGTFKIGAALLNGKVTAMPQPLEVKQGGVFLELIRSRQSVRLTDVEMRRHPDWWGLPPGHPPLAGLLGARLVDDAGKPNGVIMVTGKKDGEFTQDDEELVLQLAAITSLALQHVEALSRAESEAAQTRQALAELDAYRERLEVIVGERTAQFEAVNRQLSSEVKERAQAESELRTLSRRLVEIQEAERAAVARELHDEIGQHLTVLNLILSRLKRTSPSGSADINEALKTVKLISTQVRYLSTSLRPTMLESMGLLHTLIWYLQDFTWRTGVTVDFKHEGLERQLSADINIAVYRIIQETLTNAMRYAGTDAVRVTTHVTDYALKIEVSDSGNGFDPGRVAPSSTGLRGMRERAQSLGGTFKVESAPGKGTRITVELPLSAG